MSKKRVGRSGAGTVSRRPDPIVPQGNGISKVLLCVTLKTDLAPTWFQAYNEIAFYGPTFQTEVMTIYDFRADEARNKAFAQFLKMPKFDHILFLDSDVCIPPDTIPRLLAHKKDIVGGLYMLKLFPFPPTMFQWYRKPDAEGKNFLYKIILNYKPGDMVQCDGLATGCMMVSRRVVEAMTYPWFAFGEGGTEDIYFCRYAQKHGFEIWCDTSIECQHLRYAAVVPNDYWASVKKLGGIQEVEKLLTMEEDPWKKELKQVTDADEGEFGEVSFRKGNGTEAETGGALPF